MSEQANIDALRIDFIEKTGLATQAEGLPRIAGRVFGLLIFDGDLVSFGDLATKLQVSRASISTSIRILQERGLIKRMTKPGERQDYFQLAPAPYATMLMGLQKRHRAIQTDIAQTIKALPQGSGAADRLGAYFDFYASLDTAFSVALSQIATPSDINSGHTPAAPKDTDNDI